MEGGFATLTTPTTSSPRHRSHRSGTLFELLQTEDGVVVANQRVLDIQPTRANRTVSSTPETPHIRGVVAYLVVLLAVVVTGLGLPFAVGRADWYQVLELPVQCALVGAIGGIIYCLRAVYINACVRDDWNPKWSPWYFIRPIVSMLSGGISWLFLRAGILVLDADTSQEPNNIGFLALAFIAGYNVDKFMEKIEQLSKAAWGIEKSRASERNDK